MRNEMNISDEVALHHPLEHSRGLQGSGCSTTAPARARVSAPASMKPIRTRSPHVLQSRCLSRGTWGEPASLAQRRPSHTGWQGNGCPRDTDEWAVFLLLWTPSPER